ncbi:PQQ-dependent sugar dehydrogenase [Hydrogenophaga sp. RWCD_12]|uniref:PQQ-dependent sugar dehydrogenase n=1 Tax=Hydrogenophaga sp. RWCD_12 TaxID=3391190 RepID=UPI003985466B
MRAPLFWKARALGLGALLSFFVPAAFAEESSRYATQGLCAGYPRVALTVAKGWCVGLVADARDGLQMPRRLLEIAPGRFWITDMGNWEPKRGRLLELNTAGQAGDAGRIKVLARGLDRPHGLVQGPDGKVYVGEAGTIWRTPTAALAREDLLRDLPADGAHPLKELAFGRKGNFYLNLGSASDACRNERQEQPLPCPETEGDRPRAAVYEATLQGTEQKIQHLRPFATGLRNSLGLAVTLDASGTERVWQAENSIDYTDASAPAEELNELARGARYGWPYCVSDARGRSVLARGYENRGRCQRPAQHPPFLALPAHVAPLQLLAVPPAGEGQAARPWSGRLLSVWHGYRTQGHRVVGWRIGPDGRPTGAAENIVSGWLGMPGLRPQGTPAGITVDRQGRLWIVEDRNRSVLVVAPETPKKSGS